MGRTLRGHRPDQVTGRPVKETPLRGARVRGLTRGPKRTLLRGHLRWGPPPGGRGTAPSTAAKGPGATSGIRLQDEGGARAW
jgi:hypothetical protein